MDLFSFFFIEYMLSGSRQSLPCGLFQIYRLLLLSDNGVEVDGRSSVCPPGGLLDLQTACASWMFTATEAETSSGVISTVMESGKTAIACSMLSQIVESVCVYFFNCCSFQFR